MKRTVTLLLPLIALAVTSLCASLLLKAGNAVPASNAHLDKLADLWTASITAEQAEDYSAALAQAGAWSATGGDPYLAELRAGWLNYLGKDYERSAECYAHAGARQPAALTPLLGLLAVAQATGDGVKIQSAAERVLKVEPTNCKALMAAGEGYLLAEDYRKARGLYVRVLASYPENTDALSGAGWCTFYLGDSRGAQKFFERIASVNRDYPHVQEGLVLSSR